ncbi:MAG: M28 family peptidase, partial [bacterium]|nr:M28 family peptidase [bacterium]
MHGAKTILILIAALPAAAAQFSGASALEFTRKAVEFGPRPPGSEAHRKLQRWIRGQLESFGCDVSDNRFVARTPSGPIGMKNLICRYPGASGKVVVFSGHYDTKRLAGLPFVGANDAGSSTGWLLEMARALGRQKREHTIYIVFFDGEEAFREYTDTDGLYGSR